MGGFNALLVLRGTLAILLFFILFLTNPPPSSPTLKISILLPVALAISSRFLMRPELFSLVFAAWFIFVLFGDRHKKNSWALSLVFVQLLWVNTHGYFFIGIFMLFCFLIGDFISNKFKAALPFDWSEEAVFKGRDYSRLLGITGLCVLVSLFNPNGLEGFLYPVRTLAGTLTSQKFVLTFISELRPALDINGGMQNILYRVLIWIGFSSFLLNFRKISISKLLLFVVLCHFSYAAIRNSSLFIVVAVPICIHNLSSAYQQVRPKLPLKVKGHSAENIMRVLVGLAVILAVIRYVAIIYTGGYYGPSTARRFDAGQDVGVFPKQALDFVSQTGIRGNCFNPFNIGAYIVWRHYPAGKVSIDGRTEVYGQRICKLNEGALRYPDVWKKFNEQFGNDIDWAIFQHIKEFQWPLIGHLYDSPDWYLGYYDETTCIFINKYGLNNDVIDRKPVVLDDDARIDELLYLFEKRFKAKNELPNKLFFTLLEPDRRLWLYLTRMSMFYCAVKKYDLAEATSMKAAELKPWLPDSHSNLAHILKLKNPK